MIFRNKIVIMLFIWVMVVPRMVLAQAEKDCPPPVLINNAPWILKNGYIVYWWPKFGDCYSYSVKVGSSPYGGSDRFDSSWLSIYQNLPGSVSGPLYYATRFELSVNGNTDVGNIVVQDRYAYWYLVCPRQTARGYADDVGDIATANGQIPVGGTVHCYINYDQYDESLDWTSDGEKWVHQHELGHAIGMEDNGNPNNLMYNEYQDRYWISSDELYTIGDVYNDARIDCCDVAVGNTFQNFSAIPSSEGVEIQWEMPGFDPGECDIFVQRGSEAEAYGYFSYRRIENKFGFIDLEPWLGSTWYEITIVDEGGVTYSFSYLNDLNGYEQTRIIAVTPNSGLGQSAIKYYAAYGHEYSIRIFDIRGRLVKTLVSSGVGAGREDLQWGGLDERGVRASSGCYFCVMTENEMVVDRDKIVLLR